MDYPTPLQERLEAIYQEVCKGNYAVSWADVGSAISGHTATFPVFADALMIDGVRVNVSAEYEQKIADKLGCMLLTPKLADLLWLQRKWSCKPFTQDVGPHGELAGHMADVDWMLRHSTSIDQCLSVQGFDGSGIVNTAGKHWVVSNQLLDHHPTMAENYGWMGAGTSLSATKDANGQYIKLIQPESWFHDRHHAE